MHEDMGTPIKAYVKPFFQTQLSEEQQPLSNLWNPSNPQAKNIDLVTTKQGCPHYSQYAFLFRENSESLLPGVANLVAQSLFYMLELFK